MSKKDDLKAAYECRQPAGAVPIWELHFHCWEQAAGRHYVGRPEFDSLSLAEQRSALAANADIIIEVAEDLHFAGVTIPDSPWDCMYTLPMDARLELARLLSSRAGEDFMVVASCPGIIGMPGSHEYIDFSYKLFDAPEEIDERAQANLAAGIETSKRLRDAGVEAVYSGADIADNKGPWFSPEQLDRYIYPYLKEWSDALRSIGLYAILHTDGDIAPLLGKLASSGLHGVQAVDPVAGMDIAESKKTVNGKLCLCGNVDCGMLIVGDKSEIYQSTTEILTSCKAGGGLVLGASNAVVIETPIDNYREVIRAWEDSGSYS
jgi:uroporphyrinogen decarboxylase